MKFFDTRFDVESIVLHIEVGNDERGLALAHQVALFVEQYACGSFGPDSDQARIVRGHVASLQSQLVELYAKREEKTTP